MLFDFERELAMDSMLCAGSLRSWELSQMMLVESIRSTSAEPPLNTLLLAAAMTAHCLVTNLHSELVW